MNPLNFHLGFGLYFAIALVWVICGVLNDFLYKRMFGMSGTLDHDFLVLLGPGGFVLLLLALAGMGFLKLVNAIGALFDRHHPSAKWPPQAVTIEDEPIHRWD
jgi:hypothetical protein